MWRINIDRDADDPAFWEHVHYNHAGIMFGLGYGDCLQMCKDFWERRWFR